MSTTTRRRFLAGATGATTAALAVPRISLGRAAKEPAITIGLVADAQFADVDPAGTRFYRKSAARLAEAVEDFNGRDLAFCVHLGDFIDRDWGSFDTIGKSLDHTRHRFHHILGNHDFSVAEARKPQVANRLGLEHRRRHYALSRSGFRFVFLDTTDVSTYAHPADTKAHANAAARLENLKKSNPPQAHNWNSALGDAQLAWFDSECANARAATEKVIVFAHHPVFPVNSHNLWNDTAALAIVARHSNVVAWFNGHNHAGDFGVAHKVPFVTLNGMVETADSTAYAIARIHPDRIELAGRGRVPSRTLKFNAAT